jgi:hypothetical protein
VDGLTLSELDAKQEDVVGGDYGFTWMMEPSERLDGKHAANPSS